MINIYASFASDEPCEVHDRGHAVTVLDWLNENVEGFVDDGRVAVMLNDNPLCHLETSIDDSDTVDIYPIPKYTVGAAIGSWLASISYSTWAAIALTAISAAYSLLTQPSAPSAPGATASGSDLNNPNAQANTAKMGGIVREAFGKTKIYPDYLVPPHRYFRSKRDLELDVLCAIGNGDYAVEDVKIGKTELSSLGGDAEVEIYDANDDLSADKSHQWWQPCNEVGVSSNGQQGLPLNPPHIYDNIDFDEFAWSGKTITTTGSDQWPANWDASTRLRIKRRRLYRISNSGGKATLKGNFTDVVPLSSGDTITIDGHQYTVDSYSGSGNGTASIITGGKSPDTDFSSNSQTLSLHINGQTDDIVFDSDYTNASGVAAHINSNLNNIDAIASVVSGKIQIKENTPYSGDTFRYVGGQDVIGKFPSIQAGESAASGGELTIDDTIYDRGSQSRFWVSKYDGYYVVQSVTSTALTVDRLKEDESVDSAWTGFSSTGPTKANIYPEGTTEEATWIGPFQVLPEGEKTDRIETDFFFPGGLVEFGGDGDLYKAKQVIEIEWRELGGSTWHRSTFTYSESTPDQIGFSEHIDLGGKKAIEARARATKPRSNSQKRRDVVWYGLKGQMGAPKDYPWKTITIKLKTAHNIARQSENKINLIATRKLPLVTSSGYGSVQPTRSIAACVGEICKQIGYRESDIDFPSLASLDDFWQPRDDYFDYAIPQTTVADAINTALRAGMARLVMDHGKLTAVRDGPRTVFEQGFSAQNMTDELQRAYTSRTASDPDGVDVKFVNQDNDYTDETIKIRLPGDQGIKAETVTLHGVLDYTHAWRIGMRRRMEQKYRRWVYKWSTEMEGLNLHYLSYIPLVIDEPEYGQSAIVEQVTKEGSDWVVRSSEPLDWDGSNHVVAFRKRDGTLAGPYAATARGVYNVVISTEPPELHDQGEPIHLYFGQQDTWQQPCLVQSMTPSGDDFDVEAVNYDERIYQYDDQVPA